MSQKKIKQKAQKLKLALADLDLYQDQRKKFYGKDNQILQDSRKRFVSTIDELQKIIDANETAKDYIIEIMQHIKTNYNKKNLGKEYDPVIANMFGNITTALKDPEKAKKALNTITEDVNGKKPSTRTKKMLDLLLDQYQNNHQQIQQVRQNPSSVIVSRNSGRSTFQVPGALSNQDAKMKYIERAADLQDKRIQAEQNMHQREIQLRQKIAKRQSDDERIRQTFGYLQKTFYDSIGIILAIILLYIAHCFGKSIITSIKDVETVSSEFLNNFKIPTAGYEDQYLISAIDTINFPVKILSGALGNSFRMGNDFIYWMCILLGLAIGYVQFIITHVILKAKQVEIFGLKYHKIYDASQKQAPNGKKQQKGIPKKHLPAMIKKKHAPLKMIQLQKSQSQRKKMLPMIAQAPKQN